MSKWWGLFWIGLAICGWYWRWQSGQIPFESGQRVRITSRLTQQPTVKTDKWTGEEYGWVWLSVGSEQVGVRWDDWREFDYGMKVAAEGIIEALDKEAGVLGRRDRWILDQPEIRLTVDQKLDKWGMMDRKMWEVRKTLIDKVYLGVLPRTETGLLIGMVMGQKGELSDEFSTKLRNSGMIHVVVASGFNVMLLAGWLSGVLVLWWRRQVAVLMAIGAIWLYVWMVGAEAPVVRAGLMGSLAYMGIVLGRTREAGWFLLVAVTGMLWWKPGWLFDVGWQLSVAATAGLVWIEPLLRREKAKIPHQVETAHSFKSVRDDTSDIKSLSVVSNIKERWIWICNLLIVGESLRTTVAAQVAVFPIIMTQFGEWSGWSLITNAGLLWMVPLITSVGMLAGLVGWVFPWLSQALLWSIWPLLKLFAEVVELTGENGAIRWQMPGWIGFGYYGLLIWWVRSRIKNKE